MEPEGSLPHSQVPATCPYPQPARSSPYPTSHFLKIHLTNSNVPFHCLGLTKIPGPTQQLMLRNKANFYGKELSAPLPNPRLENHPLSAVRDCLSNIFTATLRTAGRSSIRNLRTRHAVVTGTHLSRLHQRHTISKALPEDGADDRRNASEC